MDQDMPRDPVALGNVVIAFVYVSLAADLLYTLTCIYQLARFSGLDTAQPASVAMDQLDGPAALLIAAIGIAFIVVGMLTWIIACRWIYRVNRNAHLFSDWMTMTPGWNIIWFFVPVAGLYLPFQGVLQSWQASHAPDDPASVPVPPLLRWWWGLWIVTGLLGSASLRLGTRSDTVGGMMFSNWVDVATLFADVPLAILFITLIRRLSAAQADAMRARMFE
jgi:heme/copper-type cytochrome/quinol oxidase subunit 2